MESHKNINHKFGKHTQTLINKGRKSQTFSRIVEKTHKH